jgi:hypothetical protein
MAGQVAQEDVGTVVLRLHELVTYGPWDLDISSAMSVHGYDAAKWAEWQGLLAELVSGDLPVESCLTTAVRWYREAVSTAQRALVSQPQSLAKLGVAEVGPE